MAHPIYTGKVNHRSLCRLFREKRIQCRVGGIGQKCRTRLSSKSFYMTDTVIFLIGTGQLMFLDHIIQIILTAGSRHQSGLGMIPHHLTIEIVTRFRVRFQPAIRDPGIKQIMCFGINFFRIRIYTIFKIDFRTADAVKTMLLALSPFTSFGSRNNIIR